MAVNLKALPSEEAQVIIPGVTIVTQNWMHNFVFGQIRNITLVPFKQLVNPLSFFKFCGINYCSHHYLEAGAELLAGGRVVLSLAKETPHELGSDIG